MKKYFTGYGSEYLIKNLILPEILLFLLMLTPLKAQTYLGDYSSYEIKGKNIVVNVDTSVVKFIFYKAEIVEVQYLPSASTVFDTSLVVIQSVIQNVNISVTEDDSTLSFSSTDIKIVCSKKPFRVSFYDNGGRLLLAEPVSGGLAFNNKQRIANFSLNANDHFYGTGERGTNLDKRGLAFDSFNEQIGGYTGALPVMNINVPFLASTNGYAIYFENTYPGHFDLGNTNTNKFSYTANGGELCYFFIAAPPILQQLEKYTWLTGRQPLPPRWAFGYIQSKYGYRNETAAAQMIQTMRQYKIPCDAIILDLYWFNNMGDISWNTSNWPNPVLMMNDFLNQGVKTIVISEPYITQSSINYLDADSYGFLGKGSNGNAYTISNWWSCGCNAGLIDMTNPAAQSWWWNKYPLFMDTVMAGLWTDLGEPENDNSAMNFYLGSRDKIHNIYNLLWAKTIFNGYKQSRPNQRIFNLTRSGYAGIQRYGAILWSGDVGKSFGGLAVQLPMLLNMGMSGLAYHNSDIGGFTNGYTTPELYARWMEYGTFCPITRAHGYDGIQDTEPWTFDSATTAICKKYIQLRYQLLPYIYTMAYNNYVSGIPLARPLLFSDQNDSRLINESSSYYWGDNFIVSPVVVSGQTSKSVYLPQGKWVDYWNHKQYTGGQSVTVSAPVDKLPLFVKAGSIIPMQPLMDYSDQFMLDTLYLDIYPSAGTSGSFTLYEDDGKTLKYQSGSYAQTNFYVSTISSGGNLNLTIEATTGNYSGKPVKRIYVCGINMIAQTASLVDVNDVSSPERNSYLLLRQNDGYFYDAANQKLYIQIETVPDSAYQIAVKGIVLGINKQTNLPNEYSLTQNYPNPFNPVTNIEYQIPVAGKVVLKVYDILGREVSKLVNEEKAAGKYAVQFNGSDLPSGVYIYRMQSGSFVETKKLILLK